MILCTGGVSYALFISLLISKMFCTKDEGGVRPLEGVGPDHIKLTTCTREYRIQLQQNLCTFFTDVPVFYMALSLNHFYGGKYITWAIGRGGP